MMMVEQRPFDEQELDDLFGLAQDNAPAPSDDLMAKIMADAAAVAAHNAPVAAQVAPVSPGFWASVLAMIGGWPAAAGLATAAVTGVMIGVASPDTIETLTASTFGEADAYALEDLLPSYGGFLDEG